MLCVNNYNVARTIYKENVQLIDITKVWEVPPPWQESVRKIVRVEGLKGKGCTDMLSKRRRLAQEHEESATA